METLRSTIQKAKKEHNCDYCQCKIKVGESYIYQSNVDNGDFWVWKSHINCSFIANKLNMFDKCNDGLDSDIFHEFINIEHDRLIPDNAEKNWQTILNKVVDYHLQN